MPSVDHLAFRRLQAPCWLLNMSSKVFADARHALWPVIFGGDTLFDQTTNGHDGLLIGDLTWLDGYTVTGNLGDVNFDEILNIYDAVMLVAIMLAQEEGTELQMEACDTNQDGIIDIEDIVLLFEWILGLDRSQIGRASCRERV